MTILPQQTTNSTVRLVSVQDEVVGPKSWGAAVIASSIFVFALIGLSCVWAPFWRRRQRRFLTALSSWRSPPPPAVKENLPEQWIPPSIPLQRSESRGSDRTMVEGAVDGLDEVCEDELWELQRRMRSAVLQPPLARPEPAHLSQYDGHS